MRDQNIEYAKLRKEMQTRRAKEEEKRGTNKSSMA